MKKIIIMGGNGSGKTTFARELSAKLGLPLVHLDKLYWQDNWQARPKNEFDTLLLNELKKEEWILDGNMNRTIPMRLNYCDTVFYFDFSTVRCLLGVTSRVIKNYGKTRPDMGGNCPERFDFDFYRNILLFNHKHRKNYYKMLNNCTDKDVIIFKNRKQAMDYLNNL